MAQAGPSSLVSVPPPSVPSQRPLPATSDNADDRPQLDPTPSAPLIHHVPLSNLAALPTLFPVHIAKLVTALATSAHLSLRVVAFFVEAVLETSQYSTRLSLGYTRRLLITAISSARQVYLTSHAALDGDYLGVLGFGDQKNLPSTDSFLHVLDKYTNLGIYVIHHTFTMAELFAMSGFYLTANAVQSAHFAAQESVALFDSVFGSNESSRALSSIITLVRRELLEDERFKAMDKGKITSLTALTKALTAFACLQTATWKRTSGRLHMKVLYDCTVVSEQDDSFTSRTRVTAHDNLAPSNAVAPVFSQVGMPSAIAGPGPSTLATREGQGSAGPLDVVKGRLQAHLQGSAASSARQSAPGLSSPNSLVLDDLWELEDLVGESGDDEYDGPPNDTIRQERRQKRMRDDMVEITDELTESTIITQMLERVHEDGRRWSSPWHTRQRSAPLPEVTVEDTEDEEPEVQARTTVNSPRRQSMASLSSLEDENDWIEVDQLLEGDRDAKEPPSAPNGSTSVGTQSYLDALENPSANAERIQLVLQTMTNKLLQRKRTVRRAMAEDHSDTSSREGIIRRDGSIQELTPIRPDVRSIEWRGDQQDQSGMTSSAASISSNTPSASTWASTSNYGPIAMSRFFPRQTKSPPSSYDRHAASKNSSMGRAMSRVRSAFRTKSNRTSRDTRPEASDNTRDPSTSSSISTAGLAQSPTNSPVSEIPSNVKGGVKGPPPTPYVPSQSRKSATRVARAGPDARRQPNNYPPRPSVTAVHETVRTSRNRIQAASSQPIFESPASLFPHDSLIKNVHRFMRYSSAAYGQNFLRILGLGNSEYNFPSTVRHHANSWAFAQHTNIPIDNLLLSSYAESTPAFAGFIQQQASPLVHYIAVEHQLQAVVLTCRGTLGLSDVLIDLTCEYRVISIDGGNPDSDYYVHAGMWQSALGLRAKNSTVHQTLIDALTQYPTYGLIACGHSLGGGVAALLAIACSTSAHTFLEQNRARSKPTLHPPVTTPFVTSFASGLPAGRPIHCYSYGPPAVTSLDLAKYAQGLITSVVQNSDVVPCLSLGVLRDLKNVAVTLFEESNVAEEIVGRVVGIYQRKFAFQQARDAAMNAFDPSKEDPEPTHEEVLNDWMTSLIKTMRADMDNNKLYPPGMVYILEYFDVFVTVDPREEGSRSNGSKAVVHKQAHRVILRQCDSVEERFREPLFTKSMLKDHLPSHYERSTQLLFDGMRQGTI